MPVGSSDGTYYDSEQEYLTRDFKSENIAPVTKGEASTEPESSVGDKLHEFRTWLLGDQGTDVMKDLYTAYWGLGASKMIPNPFVNAPKATALKLAGAASVYPSTEAEGADANNIPGVRMNIKKPEGGIGSSEKNSIAIFTPKATNDNVNPAKGNIPQWHPDNPGGPGQINTPEPDMSGFTIKPLPKAESDSIKEASYQLSKIHDKYYVDKPSYGQQLNEVKWAMKSPENMNSYKAFHDIDKRGLSLSLQRVIAHINNYPH